MEWMSINTGDPDKRTYHLVEDGRTQLVLKYNMLQQSIRLSGHDRHQVYYMESVNRWNTRMLFRNVYGVEVGRCSYSNRQGHGRIAIEPVSLQFALVEKARSSVILYKHDRNKPFMVCDMPEVHKQQPVQLDNLERICMLLGLGWYCSLFFNNTTAQYQF